MKCIRAFLDTFHVWDVLYALNLFIGIFISVLSDSTFCFYAIKF